MLCVPRIIGPITSWSRTLIVEGALAGATVIVREGSPQGPEVAKAAAGGGRDRLPLLPGITLTAGKPLFVAQDLGEMSGWTETDLAEVVGWPPVDYGKVPPPWFRSRVHPCGRAVWISGCVPGAEISLSQGGTVLGRGFANEGEARLKLDNPVPAGSASVTALQSAPPGAPLPSGSPVAVSAEKNPLPVPTGTRLPKPVIGEPMPMGCDAAIVIGNIVDGAEVTIARVDEGMVEHSLFDLDRLTCILSSKLDSTGGRITVSQAVADRCEVLASPPVTVGFGPAQQPPQPTPHPPCGGSRFLWVTDLKPGAELSIDVDGIVYRAGVSPAATAQLFELATLFQGDTVTVTQSACGLSSEAGVTTVGPAAVAEPPKVVGPLFKCARVVRVANVTPGALVRVIARGPFGGSPISPWRWCGSTTIAIEVSPSLVEGEEIYAEQIACGGPPFWSEAGVPVEPLPDPLPVEIAFAFATQRSVTVVALPGALVRVFRRRDGIQEIGWGFVDPENDRIRVSEPLVEGDQLFAVQYICALTSRDGPVYQVRPGVKQFHLSPPKKWPVTSEPDADVVWLEGTLTCHIDGQYSFFGKFQNQAEGRTADIEANVVLTHPAGLKFGANMRMFLAADNENDPNNKVLKQKGYKSEDEDVTTGMQPLWRDPAQWIQVLTGQATFDWLVALWTFPESEPDDAEEDPEEENNPPPSA